MNGRILRIDNELARVTPQHILTAADYEVSEVADGAEGIRQFQVGGFDMVITDILMP